MQLVGFLFKKLYNRETFTNFLEKANVAILALLTAYLHNAIREKKRLAVTWPNFFSIWKHEKKSKETLELLIVSNSISFHLSKNGKDISSPNRFNSQVFHFCTSLFINVPEIFALVADGFENRNWFEKTEFFPFPLRWL